MRMNYCNRASLFVGITRVKFSYVRAARPLAVQLKSETARHLARGARMARAQIGGGATEFDEVCYEVTSSGILRR